MKRIVAANFRIVLLLMIAQAFVIACDAQLYDPQKIDAKAKELFEKAIAASDDGKNDEAIAKLNEALAVDPNFIDAILFKASIYADIKQYQLSATAFESAFPKDSLYTKEYLLPYSVSLAGIGKFDDALIAVNQFLQTAKLGEKDIAAGISRKTSYEFAVDYAKKHDLKNYVFAPVNMGDSINSAALEYYPSLTIDGKQIVFNRRINGDEDFYSSNLVNGKWSNAAPLGGKVNTNLNEGAQNIAQDGQWLIFTACNYPEGFGSCDLYIAYRNANGSWTEAQNLGGIVNTDAWESSPSLSPDKKDLYFASNFTEGYGGKDIYVTHRMDNGKWSRPRNLGPTINTAGDEFCSFIHADNQTLYFNSNGQPGYGKADLFFSKKINDSTWSKPVNLGYPINTIDEEGSLIVAADGSTAIYASERPDSRGGLDLYSFQLRPEIAPSKTLWVKGRVFDKKTNAGLPAAIELTDIGSRTPVEKLQASESGNYLVTLPVGKNYVFNVNRKGYLFYSGQFMLATNAPDSVYSIDIPLEPIAVGASITLKNIFFDSKAFVLKPESVTELDKLVQLLTDNTQLKIQISGYTDNVGKPADNLLLSNNRSKAVVNYLLSKGIAAQRLSARGFGETQPVADNKSEEGRAMNRRTEVLVVSN